ncbi:MAG TPA: extensin family protein [Pseudolabrys sp.]|nr:extensin family protein [Pseudolabrys sp.]
MKGGARLYLAGAGVLLLALAGCGRSMLNYGERASWRHQAEVACLKSGAVKIGSGVVQISPIEGPGMCGADFPLKVAVLGESSAIGYADDPRPPGAIPNTSAASMPNWPPTESYSRPVQVQPVQTQPVRGETLRWTPGPSGIEPPRYAPAAEQPRYAPALEQQRYVPSARDRYAPANEPTERRAPAGRPMSLNPPGVALPDDIPDDAILPPGRSPASHPRSTYNAPVYEPPRPQQRALPQRRPFLGPMRGPRSTAAIMPAAVTPPATLACPLVSALDRWVSEGVQPAALRWFGAPVSEIKQISAYSCRSMVGAGTSRISEHAYGNALDIAGFILADGRKVTVKDGWRGSPEEQGFLHDVQLAACNTFSTVLAPGYNVYHYDHIHVDLMRRSSGRTPCRPNAIPGDVVAAKARAVYASKQRGPAYTGSIATVIETGKVPAAVPGEDGHVEDEDDDDAVTGSIAAPAQPAPAPSRNISDETIRAQEHRDAFH